MRTFERTVGLLGTTLAAVLRATRRLTLLVASLAVAVTACAPVAATGPPLPDPDPTEEVADAADEPAPPDQNDAERSSAGATARLEGQAERYEDEAGGQGGRGPSSSSSPWPACESAGPMVLC
jgi:hypothetical protein